MTTAEATPQRVPLLTRRQGAERRASAQALIDAERVTLAGLRDDVQDATDATAGELARHAERNKDAATVAVFALLMRSAERVRTRVRDRVRTGRRAARVASLERFGAELAAASDVLGALATALQLAKAGSHVDAAHASTVADSYVAAWKLAAVYRVNAALTGGTPPERALHDVAPLLDSRLRRLAATEIPQAYNDEHRRAGEAVAPRIYELGLTLVRRWDAILDRRTCAACAGHDGQVAPLGRPFPSGDEPGFVHPWCRCIDTVIALPRALEAA